MCTKFGVAIAFLLAGSAFADTSNLDPIPSYYQEPGLSPNRDYVNQHASEAIDPFSGKLQLHYIDRFIPGNGGMDIKIQRSYSSGDGILRDPSPYGYGWTMGFGRVLRKANVGLCANNFGSTVNPVFELPDGSRQILYVSSDTTYFISANRWKATCSGTNGFQVYSPEGTRYDMKYAGPTVGTTATNQQNSYYPTLITDRNGNTLTITYKLTGGGVGVDTVTASDGRVVVFTYDATSGALNSVKDGNSSTIYMSYTVGAGPGGAGYFNMTQATRPDGASWLYAYNPLDLNPGSGSINKLTYPTGGSFTYAYSKISFNPTLLPMTHVVTQKLGSFDSTWKWTYAYTPASTPIATDILSCPAAQVDVTVVIGPEGVTTYCHVGYNSATSSNGAGYGIGTLVGKTIAGPGSSSPTYTEGTSTAYQILSTAQSMVRADDNTVLATSVLVPLVLQRTMNVYGQTYTTQYSGYDAYGNPATVTETGTTTDSANGPDTRATALTYNIDTTRWVIHQKKDEMVTVNGSAAGATTRQFDSNFNLLSETRNGVATKWTYTPAGDIATKTDARLKLTTYSNYKRGIPQNEAQPEAVTVMRVVDDFGNVTSETDGENATTSYAYDGLNRIKSITRPAGNPVSVSWTPNQRTVVRGAYSETSTFDAFNRLSRVDQVAGGSQTITRNFTYDPIGRQTFATNPNSTQGRRTDYDALSRPTAIYFPCAGYMGGCETARYQGWNGNVLTVRNERGLDTTYTYRGFGNADALELVAINPPDAAARTTLKRNGLGQITQVSQAGFTRTYGYDPTTHFLTSAVEPETGTTSMGRDALGNLTSLKVGASATTTYGYDDRNRLNSITYPAGTASVTQTYYRNDKIKSVDNGVARRDYVYDANKNLKTETLTVGGSIFPITYAYDGNDALSSTRYPSGYVLNYTPDGLGRPTTVGTSAVSYFPNSAVQTLTLANGMKTTYALNNRLFPASMSVAQSQASASVGTSAAWTDQAYSYDPSGNLLVALDKAANANSRVMRYDPLDRVTGTDGPWGSGAIAYDGVGNVKSQTFGQAPLAYQYDSTRNRLSSTTGSKAYTFSYDAYGNVTGNGAIAFAYNDARNMKCAKCGQSGEVDYAYDGLGLRVQSTPVGGTTTYFVYSSAGLLLSEQTGTTTKDYGYLGGKQLLVRQSLAGATAGNPQVGGKTTLTLSMSAGAGTASVGDQVSFSIDVKNAGVQTAMNVKLTDVLPAGLNYKSGATSCSAASGMVECALGDLAAGAQVSVNIAATVTQPGVLTNVASASSDTPLTQTAGNNIASAQITASVPNADAVPTVALTGPLNGASFQGPATIILAANATDTDGSVTQVDFYSGPTLIGRSTSAPFTFTWQNVAPGNYVLSAKATDDKGAASTSGSVNVTVTANTPPTVAVSSPATGASFTEPANVAMTATASDSDGTISKIEFYGFNPSNGQKVLIGAATGAPYTATWAKVPVGDYYLSAIATDNSGGVTASSPVKIQVGFASTPVVSLTAPANGASFAAPATVTMTVDASVVGGTIAKVDFYQGASLVGTSTSSPYRFTLNNLPAGTYFLTARATDTNGKIATSGSAKITVVTDAAPAVTLTAPANGAVLSAPATIALSATATDSDGTISKVQFYNGTTLLGTDTTSPYAYSWANVPAGTYSLTAMATDNLGATSTSSPVTVTVNALPTASLTAPANGASYTAPASITLTATASDTDGTIAKVDFYRGTTLIGTATSAPYTVNWANVAAGTYSLTAKATDNKGGTKTSSAVSITVNAVPTVSLTAPANGATFTRPVTITLTATAADSDGTISKVEFYRGGTTLIGSDTTSPYSMTWTPSAAGTYSLTAKATDNKGATKTSTAVSITVK